MNQAQCPVCGRLFARSRADKRTCSPACKKAWQRGGWREKKSLAGWSRGRPRSADLSAGICPVSEVEPVPGSQAVQRMFPEGRTLEFMSPRHKWEVGVIRWACRVGEECIAELDRLEHPKDFSDSWCVPVATLERVYKVKIWELRFEDQKGTII